MSNEFNKEEIVAWEQMLPGFEDALTISLNVSKYSTDSTTMARTGDVIWRPMPYIMTSYDGMDQTANFKDKTQLSVPATLGYSKASPWQMDAKELRDALQEDRLLESAKQILASNINTAVMDIAALQGTLVVKRTAAASGYDDAAQLDAIMNEQGVMMDERTWAVTTRDYNGMASNLAARQTMQGKPTTAYERSFVGTVAGFDTFKMDTTRRLTAAAGGGSLTIDTRDSAVNYYIPQATTTATTGQRSNVDNRYQRITVSSTTSVAAGDCCTFATVNSVHHITKQDTGQLKTFRVISVDSSTTMTISPPIISNQVASDSSEQYQNCVVNTKASNSAIVFLNTVTAGVNPFWHRNAIELMPGRYSVPENAGAAVMRATTTQGIELVFQKQYDIKTMKTFYRVDTLFGVTMSNPEMAGIVLFSQT